MDDYFTNWQDGYPSDDRGDCMWSQGGGSTGSWSNEKCTSKTYSSICSKPIATAGESSTLNPPLEPCPFKCPAEGYFEVDPCGPLYCSCLTTNFGYLQVRTKFIWALLTMLKGNEATNQSNDSLRSSVLVSNIVTVTSFTL